MSLNLRSLLPVLLLISFLAVPPASADHGTSEDILYVVSTATSIYDVIELDGVERIEPTIDPLVPTAPWFFLVGYDEDLRVVAWSFGCGVATPLEAPEGIYYLEVWISIGYGCEPVLGAGTLTLEYS